MSGSAAIPAAPDTSGQLQSLQELPLPQAVSYAPQTIGWLFVALILLMLCAALGWAIWRRRQKQRYRRAALAELAGIETRLAALEKGNAGATERANALAAIPALIKRTTLAAAPREQVAALSGDAWLAFLQRTRGHFDARSGTLLMLASYAPAGQVAAISADEAATLIGQTRDWIEHHHVEV